MMAKSFSMSAGVRLAPSSPHRGVALDWVSRQAFGENKTGIQLYTLLQKFQDSDFADDMVLLGRSQGRVPGVPDSPPPLWAISMAIYEI